MYWGSKSVGKIIKILVGKDRKKKKLKSLDVSEGAGPSAIPIILC